MSEGPSQTPVNTGLRSELINGSAGRGGWIRIAGPLAALLLGFLAAALYLRPIGVLRAFQIGRLEWAGVTQNEIVLDGGLMTYLVNGGYAGMEPVVMIHGLGLNAALEWRDVIAPLGAAHFKVIAPNLFGFASSEHKQINHTIAYQAAAVAELIETLKLDHINLVGHGLGADVALYYAVYHPEKVERLFLVSGGMMGAPGATRIRRALIPANANDLMRQTEISFYQVPWIPRFMEERMMDNRAVDLQAQIEMISSITRDEVHIRAGLGQIFNTLTAIAWGDRDPIFPAAAGQSLHALLPGAGTVVFKNAEHWPQLDQPENFAAAAIFFLRQKEGGR